MVGKRALDDVAVFVMGGDADHIRTAAVAGEPDNAAAAVCAFHGKHLLARQKTVKTVNWQKKIYKKIIADVDFSINIAYNKRTK